MRRQAPQNLEEWLEEYQPDADTAIQKLVSEIIKRKDLPSDIRYLADYISEFGNGFDPIAMGWVGSDGLP